MHSSKADPIQVPIQLQFNDDTECLSKLLQVNGQSNNQLEHELDVSSSVSELNCHDVVADSDKEQMGEKKVTNPVIRVPKSWVI